MLELRTSKRTEIIDITDKVQEEVRKTGVRDGLAIIYTRHTTTAITINEGERGLMEDIEDVMCRLVPRGAGYKHDIMDDNADSHIRAILLGNSVVVPVSNGRLDLGTWQRVLFIELDGPRSNRRIVVKVIAT
jgi:secondary thiamine-phosphate synthase enzyme